MLKVTEAGLPLQVLNSSSEYAFRTPTFNMWRWAVACVALGAFTAVANAVDNFTMSVSPPPVPGKPFTITWNPDTSGEVVILLNVFDPSNPTLDIILFADMLAGEYQLVLSPASS